MPRLRTSVLGQPDATLYTGTLPSIRRAREMNKHSYDYRMPALFVRREGDGLRSVFVAVHDPYIADPQVEAIHEVELAAAPDGAVGLVCEGRDFTDYHLLGPDHLTPVESADSRMAATARQAIVRLIDGEPVMMAVLDGTQVRFEGAELAAPAATEADVVEVRSTENGDAENAIVINSPAPPRDAIPMERCIVTFGNGFAYGLEFSGIRREGDMAVLSLSHRPGFALTDDGQAAGMTHHPHHTMEGVPRLRVPNVLVWEK
jgi:hypothetical protein